MPPDILAVDFGTSNSAAAILKNGIPRRLPIQPGSDTLPTAVFFPTEGGPMRIGDAAGAALIEGEPGRYMRALKSVLGGPLLHEPPTIGGRRQTLADVIAAFLRELRERAEAMKLATYVTDRLAEGWTPEQIAGRLRLGIETGLRAVCAETIYRGIYRAGQKADRLWRLLTRRHARRRQRHARASRDTIAEKAHVSQRSGDADARETVGHWEADLVVCKRSRPVLVLHERKPSMTLMSRLAGKTAAETVAAMMATFRRLDPKMRGSVTFETTPVSPATRCCAACSRPPRTSATLMPAGRRPGSRTPKGGSDDGCHAAPISTRSASRTSRRSP